TVVEGKTGTFFDEQTWESLAHKILRFQTQKFNPQVIREHARQFDEANFKTKILEFIKQL
ncbi:glycosyltransferase family 4 protein, partial [bacterium]|nr:glycosyltransferase family 4 protein [bacterium]